MANWSDPRTTAVPRAATGAREAAFDAGLRSYMLSVYNYMASGVLLTGITAMLFARGGADSMAAQLFMQGGLLRFLVMLAPLGVVMWLSFGINRISEGTAKALFWAYAVLMGLSLSTILLVYTGGSVAQAFFATAVVFEPLVGELFRSGFVMQAAALQGDFVTPVVMGCGEADTAREQRGARALFRMLADDIKHGPANRRLMDQWLEEWIPVSLKAAHELQPIWSQVSEKHVRFEDSLSRSKSRMADLLEDLTLEIPKEIRA